MPSLDPDRFFHFGTPGAQEWWYFDAISDDGRDTLVLVWYAGLPFDPEYGVGTNRHLADPRRFPAPDALDHSAVSVGWYRDGRTVAYALNAYRRDNFSHRPDPFEVIVAENRLVRESGGYRLRIDTPDVRKGHRLQMDLFFQPAAGCEPLERDLGGPGSPHVWVLAAADNRVEGRVTLSGETPVTVDFQGRGYHDHNAGSEEIRRSVRRWRWGRVHHGSRTEVYYQAEPRQGPVTSLWVTCEDGRPVRLREDVTPEASRRRMTPLGVRYARELVLRADGDCMTVWHEACVDEGPFYLRWLSTIDTGGGTKHRGICERLDTRNLHSPLFNWMIPYRLKRPRT